MESQSREKRVCMGLKHKLKRAKRVKEVDSPWDASIVWCNNWFDIYEKHFVQKPLSDLTFTCGNFNKFMDRWVFVFKATSAISCRPWVSLVAVSKITFSEDLRKEKTMKYDNKCTEWFAYGSKSALGETAKCNTNTKVISVDEAHFLPPTMLCPAIPDKGGELPFDVWCFPSDLPRTFKSSNSLYEGTNGFGPAAEFACCWIECTCGSP